MGSREAALRIERTGAARGPCLFHEGRHAAPRTSALDMSRLLSRRTKIDLATYNEVSWPNRCENLSTLRLGSICDRRMAAGTRRQIDFQKKSINSILP